MKQRKKTMVRFLTRKKEDFNANTVLKDLADTLKKNQNKQALELISTIKNKNPLTPRGKKIMSSIEAHIF